MDKTVLNLEHEDIRQLLGAYALGVADPAEMVAVEQHLATCAECRQELDALLLAVQALPLGVEEREPPASLRSSILAAVDAEPRAISNLTAPTAVRNASNVNAAAPVPIESKRNSWLPWAIAAALLITSVGLLGWNYQLRNDDEPATQTIAMLPTDGVSEYGGEVEFDPDRGVMVMTTHDLPEIDSDQVYQVWLIAGEQVQSAGVMPPGDDQFAVAADPADFDVIAVTIEQGPVGVAVASAPPILAGEFDTA